MTTKTAKKHRVRISPGNVKLGRVPSVSLPPVLSCGRVPCTKLCYVVRNMYGGRYGAVIKKSYSANYDFIRDDIIGFLGAVERYVTKKTPRFFRWHVSGDFISPAHFRGACDIARRNPNTAFLAFTKQHHILPHPRAVPGNFAVVCSMWPGWGNPPAGYRRAWYQDGTETRHPGNALPCPGNCESCGFCFNIRSLRRDVIFHHH